MRSTRYSRGARTGTYATGAAALVAAFLALAPPLAAQKPPAPQLPELLKAGGDYVATYATKVSGVTLEEQFMLIENSSGQMGIPRRIGSDVVIVNVGGEITGLRDIYALDSKATRERSPRITQVLAQPTPANWQTAQRYARENAQFFQANVVLWFNDPTMALQFIAGRNQARSTFKLEGNKKMNGVQVYGVGFKETEAKGAKYLLAAAAEGNPRSSGRFWIDPATGGIHMTELWIESETDSARMQVKYAPDGKLSILLPLEASHTFESREKGTGMNAMGTGNNMSRIAFQADVRYTNARYTPIDLGRISR